MNEPEAQAAMPADGGRFARIRQRIVDSLPAGDLLRGTLAIAGATGVAQVITIVASPIITRLYTPADYGAFAVAGVVLTLLISIACLRYELAIPLPKSDGEAAHVVAVCLWASVGVSLILVPILWFEGALLLDSIGAAALDHSVWLLPIGVVAGGALAAFGGWMIRTKSFREIAASRFIQSGTSVATQIGLGVIGTGAAGLLIGSVLGSVAALAQLARATWRRSAASFRSVTAQDTRTAATRYRRFPIFSTPSIAINVLGLEVPLLWMVAAYGPDTGGQFALAQRVVALPIAVLAGAVGQVFFAEAARVVQEQPGNLRRLFGRTTRTLVLVAAVPFALGAIASPFLFPFIFGEVWSVAGLYVAILAPTYFLQFVTWPTGGTLDVLERQDLHLVREAGRLVLVGGMVAAATILRLPATQAVIALSVTGCITNLLYGYISWRAIQRVRPADRAA